jgi:Helix-turn-helix domain
MDTESIPPLLEGLPRLIDERTLANSRVLGSVATLQNWRRRGKGPPFIRIGGQIRYDREAIELWLRQRTGWPEGTREDAR